MLSKDCGNIPNEAIAQVDFCFRLHAAFALRLPAPMNAEVYSSVTSIPGRKCEYLSGMWRIILTPVFDLLSRCLDPVADSSAPLPRPPHPTHSSSDAIPRDSSSPPIRRRRYPGSTFATLSAPNAPAEGVADERVLQRMSSTLGEHRTQQLHFPIVERSLNRSGSQEGVLSATEKLEAAFSADLSDGWEPGGVRDAPTGTVTQKRVRLEAEPPPSPSHWHQSRDTLPTRSVNQLTRLSATSQVPVGAATQHDYSALPFRSYSHLRHFGVARAAYTAQEMRVDAGAVQTDYREFPSYHALTCQCIL